MRIDHIDSTWHTPFRLIRLSSCTFFSLHRKCLSNENRHTVLRDAFFQLFLAFARTNGLCGRVQCGAHYYIFGVVKKERCCAILSCVRASAQWLVGSNLRCGAGAWMRLRDFVYVRSMRKPTPYEWLLLLWPNVLHLVCKHTHTESVGINARRLLSVRRPESGSEREFNRCHRPRAAEKRTSRR